MVDIVRQTPYMRIRYRKEGLIPYDQVLEDQMQSIDAALLYALQAAGLVLNRNDIFYYVGSSTVQFNQLIATSPFGGGTFTFLGNVNLPGVTIGKCVYMRVPLGLWRSTTVLSPSDFFVQDKYPEVQLPVVLLGVNRTGTNFEVAIPPADRLT